MNTEFHTIDTVRSALISCGWDRTYLHDDDGFVTRVACAASRGVEELTSAIQGGTTREAARETALELLAALDEIEDCED